MATTLHTVFADAAFLTPTEETETVNKFRNKYQVKGVYHRRSDEDSSWTLIGTIENLKKCIKKEWGVEDPYEVIFDEDEMWVLAED